jgi:peptide/nickel transport system permease protein
MRTYIIRRLLLLIPTLFFVSTIVFLSVRLIPGDVITMMSSQSGSGFGVGVNREALERELGLDVPWYVQCSLDGRGVSRGPWGIIQGAISRYR